MDFINVLEPRMNIRSVEERSHIIMRGASRVTEQVYPADSSDNTQALFTVYPPSVDTVVDRLFKVRYYVRVEAVGGDFQIGTNDALRQFPVSQSIESAVVQINGQSISDNIGQKLSAMLCYGNNEENRLRSWSQTAAMPDQYQQYGNSAGTEGWTKYGSARNPLADYGENASEMSRGSVPVENDVSGSIKEYVVTEPLLMSPFYSGLYLQEEGFTNVNQINISLRFATNLSRVWSHAAAGQPITGINVSFYKKPELLIQFLTPDLNQRLPQIQTLAYHKPQEYIKPVDQVLAPNQNQTIFSDTLRLSQIPDRIYFFVKRKRSAETFLTSDSYARINNIQLLWNNQNSLLGNASSQQLHEMSVRNGCNLTYQQWVKHRGSVLCIKFGKDIGLPDGQAPGVVGPFTLQATIDITNISGENFDCELYTVAMLDGSFSISNGTAVASIGNLDEHIVLKAIDHPELPHHMLQLMEGGSFFSSLKKFVNKVARGVEKGARIAAPVAGLLAPEFAPGLKAIGRGASVARQLTGGRLVGGRVMRR